MSNGIKLTRRNFVLAGAAASAGLVISQGQFAHSNRSGTRCKLFVGTYTTNSKSKGIYVCDFDLKTGKIELEHVIENAVNPSFLTVDAKHRFLYSVNEMLEYDAKSSGAVSAFAIDQATGDLRLLNRQPSLGGAPCHIVTSNNGKFVLVANYVGGNVSVFPVERDGRLGASVDLVQHAGSGPNKDRQSAPHAHSITLDHYNRFAFAADLGTDRVMIYTFDDKKGKLKPNPAQPFFQAKAGAGPRHFAFHPKSKLAFVINELDSTVTSLAYDRKAGRLTEIQTVSTLAPDFKGVSACADVHVSPSGRFLYGSNRGAESITVFSIDESSGRIERVENTPTGGKRPRNFVIDSTGNFLLAANQETGNVVVFRIDGSSGRLTKTGSSIEIPAPVCLKLILAND